MNFKIGVLLIIGAQICTPLKLQSCICARNHNPVCGSDGVQYSSECFLECAARSSATDIKVAKLAPCKDPLPHVDYPGPLLCICPNVKTPVCGSDGKTYFNECALNCQKTRYDPTLKVKHSSPCVTAAERVQICPAILQLVCGSDGNTYGNNCALGLATQHNPGLSVAHDGPCDTVTKDLQEE